MSSILDEKNLNFLVKIKRVNSQGLYLVRLAHVHPDVGKHLILVVGREAAVPALDKRLGVLNVLQIDNIDHRYITNSTNSICSMDNHILIQIIAEVLELDKFVFYDDMPPAGIKPRMTNSNILLLAREAVVRELRLSVEQRPDQINRYKLQLFPYLPVFAGRSARTKTSLRIENRYINIQIDTRSSRSRMRIYP